MQNLLFPLEGNPKDVVYTPEWVAIDMIDFFKPTGKILDPCKGNGIFLKHLPPNTEWCEIREGRDFFNYHIKVDWIIGNPPYSMYAKWVYHSMQIAENFAYLFPCDKPFISYKMLRTLKNWGMLKHMRIYGMGTYLNFPVGFAVGAIHFQKGYKGDLSFSYYNEAA